MQRPPRLGDILIQAGLIDELQLHTALAEQEQWQNRLGVTLVRLGMIDEHELVQALSRKLGVPAVRLRGKRIDPAVLALVPRDLAERHACVPLFTKREAGVEVIYIGMEDPGDLNAIDELSFRTGMKVRGVIVAPTELWETLEASYRRDAAPEPAPEPEPGPTPDLADTAPHLGVSQPLDERDALLPRSAGPQPRSGGSRVPTRAILQALTQLLLDKQLIERDELLARIRDVHEREA